MGVANIRKQLDAAVFEKTLMKCLIYWVRSDELFTGPDCHIRPCVELFTKPVEGQLRTAT